MPSSVIRAYHYQPEDRRLVITFTNGRRYRYDGVPAELANEMRQAFSKGAFFNLRVRDRFPAAREA